MIHTCDYRTGLEDVVLQSQQWDSAWDTHVNISRGNLKFAIKDYFNTQRIAEAYHLVNDYVKRVYDSILTKII